MNNKFEIRPTLSDSCVELWKVARIGLIIDRIDKRLNIDFHKFFLILYMYHFKYLNIEMIKDEQVLAGYKLQRIKVIMSSLIKVGIVEKINITKDPLIGEILPEYIYRLSKRGHQLIHDTIPFLDGREDFLNY